jgi:O-antigen ligase
MGTMPHPNLLGALLVVSLMISSHIFFLQTKHRFFIACVYLIELFALVITYSRAAIFAYAIGTIFFLAWMRWQNKINVKGVVSLILVSCAIIGALLYEPILSRGGIVNSTQLSRASNSDRIFYQNVAFRMIEKHPFLGVGYGQFAMRLQPFLPSSEKPSGTYTVHNVYLILAAENGLIALIAFLGWIAWIIIAAWRASPSLPETGLLLGILVGFLFICSCDFYPIFFQQGKLLFFGAAGLLARFT